MNKNTRTLIVVGGVVVLGAIGMFAWPSGEGGGDSAISSAVVSPPAGEDAVESEVPVGARRNQPGGAGTSTGRLGAATDRSDDDAATEDGTVVGKKKKEDKNKRGRRNRKQRSEDEPVDQGSGASKKKPPVGRYRDEL